MENIFSRAELLLGQEALEKLRRSKVAVFGLGGVGSYAAEALVRGGIGHLVFVDNDTVGITNINRQLVADSSTIGRLKTEVMKERVLLINPEVKVETIDGFYLPETAEQFFVEDCDYIVDAIDTVTAKLDLAERAAKRRIPIISCLGTGNKLDPTAFRVADIYATSVCPLARVMRHELKKRGIGSLKVVYSTEPPLTAGKAEEDGGRRSVPGSVSFVPPVAGLIMAGEVIKDLIGGSRK